MALEHKFEGFKKAGNPQLGLALVFDISGFTNFFNKPDLQYYITEYINHIISCIEVNIWGGPTYWNVERSNKKAEPLALLPSMRKFLGDGVLYVWENDEKDTLSDNDFKINILNRLWNIQENFSSINKKLLEDIPVADLPATVKFGIAKGTIYKLTQSDGSIDFIGPCINLSSRLVKYCKDINFIASARLDIAKSELTKHSYFRIIAKELRSFENEIVIIDKKDFDKIDPEEKERLFQEI